VDALGVAHTVTFGVQSRADIINGLGLFHTEAQSRLGTVRDDRVRETASGFYMEAESHWTRWLRTVLGARADEYSFDVNSDLAANSGSRTAGIVSPKASVVFTPATNTELYVSGGYGFHSNDARGTTITVDPATGDPADRVSPLVRSRGAEFGVRATPVNAWRSTLAVWALDLDSELLFTGDGGATEPSAASRRSGVTFANFYRPLPALSIDADVSFARARFTGVDSNSTYIPGALENVFAGGITWEPPRKGVFGAFRVRNFGAYPLIEDNSVRARPSTLVNVDAGYRLASGTRLRVSVLNLMDSHVDDIQYYYASRLRGEPVGGVDDVHFHPAEPRQVRASVEWRF
ncbi:MAG TPA: TonB-dependent receptor, partial [Gemmatimonadaceae bacterium]